MSTTELAVAIILAVMAALVVPWLLFFFRGFLGKLIATLIPALEPRSVRGDWDMTFWRGTTENVERAKVEQFLCGVWGTIRLPAKSRTYSFRGTLRGDV